MSYYCEYLNLSNSFLILKKTKNFKLYYKLLLIFISFTFLTLIFISWIYIFFILRNIVIKQMIIPVKQDNILRIKIKFIFK